MHRLIVAAGILALLGGLIYGEKTSEPQSEGVQPKAAGQTTRSGETETNEAEKERAKGAKSHVKSKQSLRRKQARTPAFGKRRTTAKHAKAKEKILRSLASRKANSESERVRSKTPSKSSTQAAKGKHHHTSATRNSDRVYLGVFTITAYTAGVESTGKRPGDPGYGITASGAYVEAGVTAAAYVPQLPLGTVIYIDGVGKRVIQDTGSAITKNDIDLYIPDLSKATNWGVQQRKVWVIEWGG